MSKRNRRIKLIVKRDRKHDAKYDPHYLNHQPHCNDRWRAIRKLNHYPASVVIGGAGEYSFWGNTIIDDSIDRMLRRDDVYSHMFENDGAWLKKRQAYLDRKKLGMNYYDN